MITTNKAPKHSKIIFLCILLALLFSGCMIDADDRLTSMMLIKPPDKIIYSVGQDDKIDVGGAVVRTHQDVINPEGFYLERILSHFEQSYIHTNTDFQKAGVYTVFVAHKRWFFFWKVYFQYTIQVVSLETYSPQPATELDFYARDAESTKCINTSAYMLVPPLNIIYPVGYTGEIDLSGIVVKPAKGLFPKEYNITDLDYTLESDVDFNTPGNYIVKVFFTDDRGRDLWFCFTVAVAEPVER